MSIRYLAFTAVLVTLVAVVVLRGGKWERAGAAAMIAASLLTPLVQDRPNILEPQYGILAVDIALFAALTAIALRSDRWWPMWAAGFQLLGVFIHVARIIDPVVLPHAYYRGLSIYSYMVILALLAGTWRRPRPG